MLRINIFFIVASMLIIISCSLTDSDPNVYKDKGVNLIYRNMDGDNLLNPDHPDAITEQNTDIYYLINGEKERIFEENLDCPKMFCIEKGNDNIPYQYIMSLSANTIRGQDTATTYIQFSDGSMDTVKVSYEYSGSSVHLNRVWYNQELRFDPEQDGQENPYRYIVVVREQ